MRSIFLYLLLITCFIPKLSEANEEWRNNWVFKEAPILYEQLFDACTLLNANTKKASCYPYIPMVITIYEQIPDVRSVSQDIAKLRYDIRKIQLLAMNANEDVLMIDKSKEPYMAGVYGFSSDLGDYNARLKQKSYSTLSNYCSEYKTEPWFCNHDRPE